MHFEQKNKNHQKNTRNFEIKIEKGVLKSIDCNNEIILQKICDDLEKQYSVLFEFIKGENDEMEYS